VRDRAFRARPVTLRGSGLWPLGGTHWPFATLSHPNGETDPGRRAHERQGRHDLVRRPSIVGALIGVMAAVALPAATSASTSLTNGSFEDGTFDGGGSGFQTLQAGATNLTGWTVGGAGIDWIGPAWTAQDGSKSLDMNAGAPGSISQDLETTANSTYGVQFYLAGNPACEAGVKTLTVNATGAPPKDYTFDTTGHSASSMGWTVQVYSFVATSANSTLTFTSATSNSGCGPALDNVSVTVEAPPSDSTAPTVTYTQSPDGSNDWFKTAPATLIVTATDPDDGVSRIDCTLDGSAASLANVSGIGTGTASGEVSTSVEGLHAVSCTATDSHDNTTAPAATTGLRLDTTAPVITDDGFASGTAGLNGWYTTAVTENFRASDSTSGLADCGATFTKDSGTSQSSAVTVASGSCSDNAGNTNAGIDSVSYMIDLTDPYDVTFVGGPADGASYPVGSVPAVPTCTASDLISGFDRCTVTGYSTSAGSHTLMATAYDVAGRSATAQLTYTVLGWTLVGFYSPVDMEGVWNTVQGGSTIPFKFDIFDGSTKLQDTADVTGFAATPATCPDGSATTDPIEVTATGATSLRFAGQFVYNWQTPETPGACYVITMTARDGSTLSANFILK
jgi:choice-of-anchor C domain-containing protein